MKVVFNNSTLGFKETSRYETISYLETNKFIYRGTGRNDTGLGESSQITDYIEIGEKGFEVAGDGLLYGYDCAPYWYYDKNKNPIEKSCSIYNVDTPKKTDNTTFKGYLNDIPKNAVYVRFSQAGSNTFPTIIKYV